MGKLVFVDQARHTYYGSTYHGSTNYGNAYHGYTHYGNAYYGYTYQAPSQWVLPDWRLGSKGIFDAASLSNIQAAI